MIEQVRQVISDFTKIPMTHVTEEANLMDVIAESFQLVELMLILQEDFEISLMQDDLNTVKTIGELARLVEAKSKQSA